MRRRASRPSSRSRAPSCEKGIDNLGVGARFPAPVHLARSPKRVRAVPFLGRRALAPEGATALMIEQRRVRGHARLTPARPQ